jgi:hypothetical protein
MREEKNATKKAWILRGALDKTYEALEAKHQE